MLMFDPIAQQSNLAIVFRVDAAFRPIENKLEKGKGKPELCIEQLGNKERFLDRNSNLKHIWLQFCH